MENPNERAAYLIIQHLKDKLTSDEQFELQTWLDASPDNRELFGHLSDPDRLQEEVKEYAETRVNTWDKIEASIKTTTYFKTPAPIVRPIRRVRAYIAAASLLIVIITGYFWLSSRHAYSEARPASVPVAVRDAAPGGDKATLTLADGSRITLENAADGSLPAQGAAHISKDKNSLSYTVAESAPAVVYNTLTTPRAGQFRITLPDGTKVWLNNASSLRYPTSFNGLVREVQLEGEAYFEVAKNVTQPFYVKIPDATVNVLGTSFNIMAYADEPFIRTTVLTGKVSLTTWTKQSILSPGQQAVLNHKGKFTVEKNIDIEEAIAWKEGLFEFNSADIETVMRALARWYNVDIRYESQIPDHRLTGKISRDMNASDVLQILSTSGYHFKIDGRVITVMP